VEEQEFIEELEGVTEEDTQMEDEKDGIDDTEEDYRFYAEQDDLFEEENDQLSR
jgi:hypothetical protein